MVDPTEISDQTLYDFGEGFSLPFGTTIQVLYSAPGKLFDQFGSQVMSTSPTLSVKQTDVDAYDIGIGTVLTRINTNTEYQVSGAPEPDGYGLCILTLTTDF